ncbi:MAG: helix-turn-helix domain-containing protein [Thalassobaculaceae bacterium]
MSDDPVPLTGFLAELAELVGEKGARRLAQMHGGTRLYVPERLTPDHPLVTEIGYEAALSLVHAFKREHLEIPLGPSGAYVQSIRSRREIVSRLDEQGKSAPEIARAAGVHSRTVYRHRAKGRPDPNQPGLFDE